MKLTTLKAILVVTLVLFGIGVAHADSTNIGSGAFTTNATGQLAQDPTLLGTGTDLSVWPHGSDSITNDFVLVVLIPNDTTDLFGATNPLGTITVYPSYPSTTGQRTGSSAFTGTALGLGTGTATYAGNGFWGDITGSSTKVSDFTGAGFSSSINLSNLELFDSSLGITASSYGVYTFLVTTGSVPTGGLVDIQIPGGLPTGSGLAVVADTGANDAWTQGGGVNDHIIPAPETSSLLMLGTGLLSMLGLVSMGKRLFESA